MDASFASDDDHEPHSHPMQNGANSDDDEPMEDADAGSDDNADDDDNFDDDNDDDENAEPEPEDDEPDPDPDGESDGDGEPEHEPEADGEAGEDDSLPRRSRSSTQPPVRPLPTLRQGADAAPTYDIVPYVAAPQSTSINAFTATPCMRWIFTGGSDGYIRRYDWFSSINGKVPLTVAQKHPFVDSVTRAGVLLSYWENEEPPVKNALLHVPETTDDLKLSPVYSLAVHSQALWLLSGLESGGINLQSVRHDESKIITTLRHHTSAVSVLTLASDERSVLSGSWDRQILDWDLNTGVPVRTYPGSAGQISSLEFRPLQSTTPWVLPSTLTTVPPAPSAPSPARSFNSLFGDSDPDSPPPAPPASPPPPSDDPQPPATSGDIFLSTSMDGVLRLHDRRSPTTPHIIPPARGVPPWCMSGIFSVSGNSIFLGRRNSSIDEYDLANLSSPSRIFKLPLGSGPVSALCAMPNGRHVVAASFDNLRLWDLEAQAKEVGFLIVPGHHGGVVSKVYVDRTCGYMVSLAGNRGWEGVSTEVWLGYEIGF